MTTESDNVIDNCITIFDETKRELINIQSKGKHLSISKRRDELKLFKLCCSNDVSDLEELGKDFD